MLSPWTPTVWLKQTVGAVIQCQFHCFVTELRHHATMSIPLKRHILLTPSHNVNFIVSSYNYVTVKQRQFYFSSQYAITVIQRQWYCLVTEHRYRNTRSILLFRHRITSPCYNVNFIITSQTVDALYCCNVNSIVHTVCALQQRRLYCFVTEGRRRATASTSIIL